MINKHKGGGIMSDIKNMQNELAYTSDDTYLFNYKNKKQELDKLLYKLSKYEKSCRQQKKLKKKLKKKNNSTKKLRVKKKPILEEEQTPILEEEEQTHDIKKEIKKQQSTKTKKHKTKKHETKKHETKKHETKKHETKKHETKKHETKNHKTKKHETKKHETKKHETNKHEKKKNERETLKGGTIMPRVPSLLFVPVIGPILFDKNNIKIKNNSNFVEDLLLFVINHLINIFELAAIIYLVLNSDNITNEEICVICAILGFRILSSIFIYKKENNIEKKNKQGDSYNKTLHKIIILLVVGLPLFILLFNSETYKLIDNIVLTFLITLLTLPYFRLLYSHINENNFNSKNGLLINIVEKFICGLIIYIIIMNNFEINAIFDFLKNINSDEKIEVKSELEYKSENIDNEKNSSENILLNNFNNLFKKKYI